MILESAVYQHRFDICTVAAAVMCVKIFDACSGLIYFWAFFRCQSFLQGPPESMCELREHCAKNSWQSPTKRYVTGLMLRLATFSSVLHTSRMFGANPLVAAAELFYGGCARVLKKPCNSEGFELRDDDYVCIRTRCITTVLSPTHIHTQRVPIPHESAALGCAHKYTRDVDG